MWAEREDDGIDIGDVHPLAAAIHTYIKFYSVGFPDPAPGPSHGPSSACSPTGRLAHSSFQHSSQGASPTITFHCCTQLGQYRKLLRRNIISWGCSTTNLAFIRQQIGSKSSTGASSCGVSNNSSPWCLNAHSLHWFPPTCLLEVLKMLLTHTFSSSQSQCILDPAMWEARHGSFRAPSGSVLKWLESAGGDTTSSRLVWHAPPWIFQSFFARLFHSWVLFHKSVLQALIRVSSTQKTQIVEFVEMTAGILWWARWMLMVGVGCWWRRTSKHNGARRTVLVTACMCRRFDRKYLGLKNASRVNERRTCRICG